MQSLDNLIEEGELHPIPSPEELEQLRKEREEEERNGTE